MIVLVHVLLDAPLPDHDWSEEILAFARRIAERLASEIPGARHAVVEGAGHLPALERPDETSRLVHEFLQGHRI